MIKLKPSYQVSDGKCYATYEEAQKAELLMFFYGITAGVGGPPTEEIVAIIVEHASEIREILKDRPGRPTGSKNGTGRKKRGKGTPDLFAENAALQDMKQ